MDEKVTEELVLIAIRMTYPFFGLEAWLSNPYDHPFHMTDKVEKVTFPIFAKSDDQRKTAKNGLKELMDSLGIELPELATHQPPQVVAATYARLLSAQSYGGWPFAEQAKKLKVIEMTAVPVTSKHHHKKTHDYHFKDTGKVVDREAALVNGLNLGGYIYTNEWLDQAQPIEVPDDFLLWFDRQKKDRGDVVDANLMAKSLSLKGRGLQEIFYRVKFEMADVIYYEPFHGHDTANLPAGIFPIKFARSSTDNLAGILVHYRPRPDVTRIYWAGVKGKLPDKEWNGQWISK